MGLLVRRGCTWTFSIPSAVILLVAWQARAQAAGCCFSDGSCITAGASACLHGGGTPVTSCTPDACLGACCSDNGCELTTGDACTIVYYGIGTTCQVCQGACCFGDGGCAELTPASCGSQGGVFGGLETLCASTMCDGACCLADGGCEEIGPDPCASAGGEYQGRGVACEPVLAGDLDCDGSLLPEWGSHWLDCFSGPEQTVSNPACDAVDLDIDGDVDLGDVAFLGLLQGYQACADVPFPCCGNGVVELGEHCDDDNNAPGDGCDGACRSECGRIDWQVGQVITYTQGDWGQGTTRAAQILSAGYNDVYASTFGIVEVGIAGSGGYSMQFTGADAVIAYLPATGPLGPLAADLVDPTTSFSGAFGGEVVALRLNIDFSDAGRLEASTSLRIGDVRLCGTDLPSVNGLKVRDFAGMVNSALGGGLAPHTISELYSVLVEINAAFDAGIPSQWARDHLVVGSRQCVPGTVGCGWVDGDMVSYSQDSWGADPKTSTAAALVGNQFNFRYPGGLEVGSPGASGFSMTFTSGTAILDYEPASGTVGPLNSDLQDPTSSASGAYGGYVLALQLDVDFADSGHISSTSGLMFGDLRLCGLTATPTYNGMTMRQFLAAMNTALGAVAAAHTYDDMAILTNDVSAAFEGGTPSAFAQDHLFNGACPCTPGTKGCGWTVGDIVTYTQSDWGDATTSAGVLLNNRFNDLYGALGYVEAGIPGAAGFSMLLTSAAAVFTYQPASGPPAPLNADLIDPTSTASGVLGGEVLALRFNIDLSDADLLSGTSNLDIGNLTLCGLVQTGLNGMTVRAFQDVVNTALGGGSAPYALADLTAIARNINSAFASDAVSLFAQKHLVNGPCGWENGDMISYSQDSWGDDPTQSTAAALLVAQFDSRFPTGVEVGIAGLSGFSMVFTSAAAILDYLPASGSFAPLNGDLLDPTSSASGAYGGYVLALQLDLDFTDSGHVSGTSGLKLGDLRLCGLAATPGYNDLTIRQFLGEMNTALGGGPAGYGIDEIANLTNDVTAAFEGGLPSAFAQDHLFNGPCPCTPGAPGCGWEDGQVITYSQAQWGAPPTSAGILLDANYGAVYASTFGIVEIGLAGAAGFSIQFTSASAAFAYQPSSGSPAPLNADLVDPIASASGVFGGEVLALRFNIDFSDVGLTTGTSGLRFGDLILCNPTNGPSGISVRAFMDVLNTALGGGATPYAITDLSVLTQDINAAFMDGSPNQFAQDHLFNGPCPCTPGAPGCGWAEGELVTYNQDNWGTPAGAASTLLNEYFPAVFPSGVAIGDSRPSRNYAYWTTVQSILDYLPASGSPGPLDNDLVDPTSTSSGALGGDSLALRLNVGFDDAGVLPGTAPLSFAALRVCGLTATPGLNGMSVSQVLDQLNLATGGDPIPYSFEDLDSLARELTESFESGVPSPFAQDHLFNGACP